jgi:hypothetical protein
MSCCKLGLSVLCFLGIACSLAHGQSPEDVLKKKGIVVNGGTVALESEKDLDARLLEDNKLSRDHGAARTALANAIKQNLAAQNLIVQMNQEKAATQARINVLRGDPNYNRTQILQLTDKIKALDAEIKAVTTNLQSGQLARNTTVAKEKVARTRDAYGKHLAETRVMADKFIQAYAAAASDEEVKAAIEKINQEQGKSIKMVESTPFQTAIKKLRVAENTLANIDKQDGTN